MDTKQQKQAKAQLERAFAACGKAKISFIGMDSEIIAYDANDFEKAKETRDAYDAARFCEGETVNTHSTYLDSGGW